MTRSAGSPPSEGLDASAIGASGSPFCLAFFRASLRFLEDSSPARGFRLPGSAHGGPSCARSACVALVPEIADLLARGLDADAEERIAGSFRPFGAEFSIVATLSANDPTGRPMPILLANAPLAGGPAANRLSAHDRIDSWIANFGANRHSGHGASGVFSPFGSVAPLLEPSSITEPFTHLFAQALWAEWEAFELGREERAPAALAAPAPVPSRRL